MKNNDSLKSLFSKNLATSKNGKSSLSKLKISQIPSIAHIIKLPGSETGDGRVYSATNTKPIATKTN